MRGPDVEEEGAPEGEGDPDEGRDIVAVDYCQGEEEEAEGEEEVSDLSFGFAFEFAQLSLQLLLLLFELFQLFGGVFSVQFFRPPFCRKGIAS